MWMAASKDTEVFTLLFPSLLAKIGPFISFEAEIFTVPLAVFLCYC
jgi:hypothetical protein